jgi:CarD family transcriptional regulator
MPFQVGQTLVYPHHGAVTITGVEVRPLKGVDKTFITLSVSSNELTITIPADNIDLIGVRDVIDDSGVQAVFATLREAVVEEPSNWSRRYKANQEKMASGNVIRVGEVVRDLWRRDRDRGLSAGEKRMLLKSREILESELTLALQSTPEEASVALDEVLASVDLTTVAVEAVPPGAPVVLAGVE